MLLSDHIIIQLCLDPVWRRNVPDIQNRFRPFALFLFLDLLLIGDTSLSLKVCNIQEPDIGKSLFTHILIQAVHKIRIQHTLIIKLAHSIHGLMHTVITYTNIIGKLEHLSRFAFRPPADKADILIIAFLLIFCQRVLLILVLFIKICHIFLLSVCCSLSLYDPADRQHLLISCICYLNACPPCACMHNLPVSNIKCHMSCITDHISGLCL